MTPWPVGGGRRVGMVSFVDEPDYWVLLLNPKSSGLIPSCLFSHTFLRIPNTHFLGGALFQDANAWAKRNQERGSFNSIFQVLLNDTMTELF